MSHGAPAVAEITLYGADEATLGLARYQIPTPLAGFYAGGDAYVSSAHTRDDLASLFDWKKELRDFALGNVGTLGHGRGGGTGSGFGHGSGRLGATHTGARGSEPRRDFRQTAFFYPSLVTDEQGHLRARVKLPESVTTYRTLLAPRRLELHDTLGGEDVLPGLAIPLEAIFEG